jgi:hypothetical protein
MASCHSIGHCDAFVTVIDMSSIIVTKSHDIVMLFVTKSWQTHAVGFLRLSTANTGLQA